MLLNEIVPCDPPLMSGPRPLPIDTQILDMLAARGPMELAELTAATGDSTHRVHARLTSMMKRGLVQRRQLGARTRGPGASVYVLARPDDDE
jgi:predicted transcriptional regulator